MDEKRGNLSLSRGQWTLARYLATRSPEPMPPVVRANDDLLHVAKVTATLAMGEAVYVMDNDDHYVGAISNGRLARRVFEQLDPSLFVSEHAHATTGLLRLGRSVAGIPASSLMEPDSKPLRGRDTVAEAMRSLYQAKRSEAPVVSDTGKLLGVIRALDILREWAEDTLLTQMGDETESFY